MAIKGIIVNKCPYCGGTEFTEGKQDFHGAVQKTKGIGMAQTLYHVFCTECGSVVRSYVYNPKKLSKYPPDYAAEKSFDEQK